MLKVVKQEGWERLYGGLAPSLAGTAASQVCSLIGVNIWRICNFSHFFGMKFRI